MPKRPAIHRPTRLVAASPADRRETAAQRGYGGTWQRYRIAFFAKPENSVCRECAKKGKITPPKVIDHIIPHKGDSDLFWDPKNHQPLCKQCHDRKTAKEDGGFGRPVRGGGVA